MNALALAVLAALCAARAEDAAGVDEAARTARGAFLEGRHGDAASSWRYLSKLGVAAHDPETNLALALREGGDHEAAVPQWVKASLVEGADGFAWNGRGWSYLAVGRRPEAKEAFEKALDRSSTTASQAEANLGLGLTAILDAKPRAAFEPLRRAGLLGPYAISAAARLTAEASRLTGDPQASLTYLRQSLEVDPLNFGALADFMRLLDKIGDNRTAWRAARRLLSFDPGDAEARRVLEKNAKFMKGDLDAAAGVRRIGRPVLFAGADEPPLPRPSREIRVGLYGAPDGRPAVLTRAYLMANAPFKVTSTGHGTMRDDGRAGDQWEVEFRPETNLVEVRDASRRILFTSKQPFQLVTSAPRGSVLVKSAELKDTVGVDIGDREVRSALEVIPTPWGFRLVQVAPLELYLFGVVSHALPPESPPQAYRAQAVVARTAAVWAMEHRPETLERTDLLDDDTVQRTIGVSGELAAAAEAVLDTQGLVLAKDGLVAAVAQHEDSGGVTEDGAESGDPALAHLVSVQDSARPAVPWRTPADLERFIHEAPPEGLFSESAAVATPAAARWLRVVDGKTLRARVERRGDIGPLRGLRAAARTPSGRVKSLEVVGARGVQRYDGFKEISALLSPGTLRSTMFSYQPVFDGKTLDRVVLWGAGTGHGLGFPRAGTLGQAAQGAKWEEILRRYFPRLQVRDLDKPMTDKPAVPAGVGPYKRTKNFRLQKPKEKK
ncbi:MAG: SpoIID/LytB domain-containing protein [Elusimicrobiota bacterium]|nr:SpoIID/LytB domain-containing protein [Elusimicrobiota bacterium]